MSRIRAAYAALAADLKTDHPFAHQELHTDGQNIFRVTADRLGDRELLEVISRQRFFCYVIDCLHRIDYRTDTRLAFRWRISESVVIDPTLSFGKPVVAGTGVSTFVLANSFRANGGNAALVADLFNVSEAAVHDAEQFEHEHGRKAA